MPIYLTGDRVQWCWDWCGHCTGTITAIDGSEYATVRSDVGGSVLRVLLTSLSHWTPPAYVC